MIKKIKASRSEKIIFIFIILLATFSFGSFLLIKDKCLFVKDYDPKKIKFNNPKNIAILDVPCGNVIIELYPEISPNGVKRFKTLIKSNAYDNILVNIEKNVIVNEVKTYFNKLALDGFIYLSGFYFSDEDTILKKIENLNLKLKEKKRKNKWSLLIFQKYE